MSSGSNGNPWASPRGFTLVELLITITIIGIMSSMLLFAMVSAQETARADKTRAIIAKIHPIIMHRYEAYRSRRVPVSAQPGVTRGPLVTSTARVDCIRELMRMELPDRWSDIIDEPVTRSKYIYDAMTNRGKGDTSEPVIARPAISQAYLRRYKALVANGTPPTGVFQGAECLYMIVTAGLPDEAGGRDLFHDSEIGDVDKDGAPEIIDGWGNPIRFLRWAPGFTTNTSTGFIDELQTGNDPDPFDPRHIYGSSADPDPTKRTFALYPLIYSAGPDQFYGIASDFKPSATSMNAPLQYSKTMPPNNPYIGVNNLTNFPDGPIGSPGNLDEFRNGNIEGSINLEDWKDDIHNHLIGSK